MRIPTTILVLGTLLVALSGTGVPGQQASFRLDDDATASGYGGNPVRMVELGGLVQFTVVGPVGFTAYLFAGLRLEPGIPIPGSPNPIGLLGPVDITFLLGAAAGVIVPEDHIVDGQGRIEAGLLLPPLVTPVPDAQLALQAVLVGPGFAQVLLTNPIEIVIPGSPPGPPVTVEVQLASQVVEEVDEGPALVVSAVARDAAGRALPVTPPFTVSTTAPGATYPGQNQIAFPAFGTYNVSVSLTGMPITGTTQVRVSPETLANEYVDFYRHMSDLSNVADTAVHSVAAGNTQQYTSLLASLTSGISPANIPGVFTQNLLVDVCGGYPSEAQLNGSGFFPPNASDPQYAPLLNAIDAKLQALVTFLTNTPLGLVTPAVLAELHARYEELKSLLDQLDNLNVSSREQWARRVIVQLLLNQRFAVAINKSIEHLRRVMVDLPTSNFNSLLDAAVKRYGALGKILSKSAKKAMALFIDLSAQIIFNNMVAYTINSFASMTLSSVIGPTVSGGAYAVMGGQPVELCVEAFVNNPACYRVCVATLSNLVTTVQSALTNHDTTCDYTRALGQLQSAHPTHFAVFPVDGFEYQPLLCGYPALLVNSWPLTGAGIQSTINVFVLRLDGQLSTVVTGVYQL